SLTVTHNTPSLALMTTSGALLPYDQLYVPAMKPANFWATYTNFCVPAISSPAALVANFGPVFQFSNPAACVNPRQTIRNWGISLTTDAKILDNLSIKNIVAFRGYSADWVHDNDESIWALDLGAESMGHHQFSE